ncbi:signal peptidase I [Patescibacteria group bacterium]|nr:signal peptidase I [Patescibacteria group bacterium]
MFKKKRQDVKPNLITSFITESLEVILFVSLVFIILNIFLGQLLIITGDSMYPTLLDQEQILGEKLSLKFFEPKRGEIFIFKQPVSGKLLIKRLIALPSEEVLIKDGKVFINGEILKEPYIEEAFTHGGEYFREGETIKVPEGKYLFMGDNRERSLDGRDWGFVDKEQLESRAFLVYYPIENLRLINRDPKYKVNE